MSACWLGCGTKLSYDNHLRICSFLTDEDKKRMVSTSKKSNACFWPYVQANKALRPMIQEIKGICLKASSSSRNLTEGEYWAMQDFYIRLAKIHARYNEHLVQWKPQVNLPLQYPTIRMQLHPSIKGAELIYCNLTRIAPKSFTLCYVPSSSRSQTQSDVSDDDSDTA